MNLPKKHETPRNVSSNDFEKPKVLIVDDRPARLFELEALLNRLDVTLFEAHSGKIALELVIKHDFALMLVRADLKDVNGYDLAREMRARPKILHVPVIVIDSSVDEEKLEEVNIEEGTLDFIQLPLQESIVIARVSTFLRSYQFKRALEKEEVKRRRLEEKLKRSAQMDDLTFIANRRFFKQQYIVEWRRMLREYKPFSLIMVHIDGFDIYRDAYGPQASDLCLIKVGKTIKGSLRRAADFVARIEDGGFVAVMPNTDAKGATLIAERVKENVNALGLEHLNSMVAKHITVSQGIGSVTTSPHIEPNELIGLADQALFKAKKEGGNCHFLEEYV